MALEFIREMNAVGRAPLWWKPTSRYNVVRFAIVPWNPLPTCLAAVMHSDISVTARAPDMPQILAFPVGAKYRGALVKLPPPPHNHSHSLTPVGDGL